MTKSPMLWGAGLACALGGAVAGNALGSTPILNRPAIGFYYQAPEGIASEAEAEARALPDHYPLVTRDGTVPVAQLSERGLYSQGRYRALYGPVDYAPAAFAEAHYETPDESGFPARDASLVAGEPAPEQPATEASAPLELAAGPASLTAPGRAKTIDVDAVLAMR